MRLPVLLTAVVPLVLCVALAGCSSDPTDDYCEAVEDHQAALTDVAASDDTGALFDVLDTYDELRAKAPRDIADDWASVIEPLRELEDALDHAGVDPSTYSSEKPPADVSQEDRDAIEAAARKVGSERTVTAMGAVEQHALDVCGTPLSR
ncbi:hypothetical protein ASC64_08675 [Nocardioides sp. Root122]|uniref:hypothetical protein n=1 Tax=Nocardioides TaxID=1839 RepID=UPI000703776A|nr:MULTISPECIES: hypothetical protein [Nocardioides]KQV69872.1 hypothetical protein ASC64_08675 [Nocardioides sp. Root122]MCK9822901.1 hypothetical protein [Nocardioides cavernae]